MLVGQFKMLIGVIGPIKMYQLVFFDGQLAFELANLHFNLSISIKIGQLALLISHLAF